MQGVANIPEAFRKHFPASLAPEPALPRVVLGHARADAVLKGGLVLGALHEVFAAERHADGAATVFAAALAARASPKKTLLWIAQDYCALEYGALCPTGLLELGLDPARLLLLRAPDAEAALRAGLDGLSCRGLGAVIIELNGNPKSLDLVATRKLTLAAAAKRVTPVLLRLGAASEPSSAETRWSVRTAPSSPQEDWGAPRFDAALTRNRHGTTGNWVMEWDCDHGVFREPADLGAVAAASAH